MGINSGSGSLGGGGGFNIQRQDYDALNEAVGEVSKGQKKEGKTADVTRSLVTSKDGKIDENVFNVSITGVTSKQATLTKGKIPRLGSWDIKVATGTGQTAKVQEALVKGNKVATFQLAVLNQKLGDLQEQVKLKAKPTIADFNEKRSIETEKEKIGKSIESRDRLISKLDTITKTAQVMKVVKRVASFTKWVFDKVIKDPLSYIIKTPLNWIEKKTGIGEKLEKAAGTAADHLHGIYQFRRGIPREVTHAITTLKEQMHKGKDTDPISTNFAKAYNDVRNALGSEYLQARFDKEVGRRGAVLALAVLNNNTGAEKFLLDKGLYEVSKRLLKQFDHVEFQTIDQREEFTTKLFNQGHNPDDMSMVVSYLCKKGDSKSTALAKELVNAGLDKFEPPQGSTGKSPQYIRCQMLATRFGDNALFLKAFNVNPGELYGEHSDPTKLKEIRDNFIREHANALNDHTEDGDGILHMAVTGENHHMCNFLYECLLLNHEANITQLEGARAKLNDWLLNPEANKGGLNDLVRAADSVGKKGYIFRDTALINIIPTWLQPDDSIKTLVEKYERDHTVKNAEKIITRMGASIEELKKNPNPFCVRNKNLVKPKQLMNINLANDLDRLKNIPKNAKGSFSNMVAHRQFVHEEFTKKEIAFMGITTLVGKFIGCLGPTKMLMNDPTMSTVKELPVVNGPLFAGGGLGFLAGATAVYGLRRIKASLLGMDTSLSKCNGDLKKLKANREPTVPTSIASSNEKVKGEVKTIAGEAKLTPKQQLKVAMNKNDMNTVTKILENDSNKDIKVSSNLIKAFSRLYCFDSNEQKTQVLLQLCMRCDERKIYKLLDKQITLGDKEVVGKIINQFMVSPLLNKLKSDPKFYQGLLQVAAKLGDRDLLINVMEKGDDIFLGNSRFLLKTVEPKSGDTLLHLAMTTKDPTIISLVADKMSEASGRLGGEIIFRRPRTGAFKNSTLLNLFRAKEKKVTFQIEQNIYEIPNAKTGKIVTQSPSITRELANQIDEIHGVLPTRGEKDLSKINGTVSHQFSLEESKHGIHLTSEVLGVAPFKGVLNVVAGEAIKELIFTVGKITAHSMSAGTSLLVTTLAEFGTGMLVMGTGFGGGAIIGGMMGEQLFKLNMKLNGYDATSTKLAVEGAPPDAIAAQFSHARRNALKLLKKEKLTENKAALLRTAYSAAADNQIAAAMAEGDIAKAHVLGGIKEKIKEYIQPGNNKAETQRKLMSAMMPLGQEAIVGLVLTATNHSKRQYLAGEMEQAPGPQEQIATPLPNLMGADEK